MAQGWNTLIGTLMVIYLAWMTWITLEQRRALQELTCLSKGSCRCIDKSNVFSPALLMYLVDNAIIKGQVAELGAGLGDYTRYAQQHGVNMRAFDHAPECEALTGSFVKHVDLLQPKNHQSMDEFDWIVSIHTGEHLPPVYEDAFLDVLTSHARDGIVLGWNAKWTGNGSINRRSNNHIKERMMERGWLLHEDITQHARQAASSTHDLLQDSIMVFKKHRVAELDALLGFDRIYVINLPNRQDRRDSMDMLKKELGVSWDYHRATSVADMARSDYQFVGAYGQRPDIAGIKPATAACWQSHMSVWKDMVDKGIDSALILEDDVDMDVDIKVIMAELQESMRLSNVEWDVLYLGHCMDRRTHKVALTAPMHFRSFRHAGREGEEAHRGHERLFASHCAPCLHGYALSSRAAKLFLEALAFNPSKQPVDMAVIGHCSALKVFTVHPVLIEQIPKTIDRPSDITSSLNTIGLPMELRYGAYNLLDSFKSMRFGVQVTVQTENSRYLCYKDQATSLSTCDKEYRFLMSTYIGPKVAIKIPSTGRYLNVNPEGGVASGDKRQSWETFQIAQDANAKITLTTYHNTCFGREGNMVTMVTLDKCTKFDMEPATTATKYHYRFRTSDGAYLHVNDKDQPAYTAKEASIQLELVSLKTVSFKAHNGKYMQAPDKPGSSINLSPIMRTWETMDLVSFSNVFFDTVQTKAAIRTWHNTFIQQKNDGSFHTAHEPQQFIITTL